MSAYTERIREDRVTTKEDITMKFELARSGNLLIVQVAGELDHHFADEIRMRIDAEIMKPPIRNILFDFNRLSFMDSSGIGLVMGRYRLMQTMEGEVRITEAPSHIVKVMKLAGMDKLAAFEK